MSLGLTFVPADPSGQLNREERWIVSGLDGKIASRRLIERVILGISLDIKRING